MNFFYPNPQNDMWRIIGQIFFGDKLHFCTSDKRFKHEDIVAFCNGKGIALFDTAQAVRRLQGNAADEHLEVVEPSDIASLLSRLPLCHDICCTGGKAAETLSETIATWHKEQLGVDAKVSMPKVGGYVETDFAGRRIRFWRMPSSSRAYPLSLEKKAAAYRHLMLTSGLLVE